MVSIIVWLVGLLIACVVVGLVYYIAQILIGLIPSPPIPPWLGKVILALVLVLGLLWIIMILLGQAPLPIPPGFQ